MIRYLNDKQLYEILRDVSVYKISSFNHKKLTSYEFDCGNATEYKSFLFYQAKQLDDMSISKTYIIVSNLTDELIGYFTLSADSIRLTYEEKNNSNLNNVNFMSLPAIKIGKLAINKKIRNYKKGYGSLAIELATYKAREIARNGVACRFLVVDADIEYDKNTPNFYLKNGFVYNLSKKRKPSDKTVSMRKDIFA